MKNQVLNDFSSFYKVNRSNSKAYYRIVKSLLRKKIYAIKSKKLPQLQINLAFSQIN
jgi:hypothetical protein